MNVVYINITASVPKVGKSAIALNIVKLLKAAGVNAVLLDEPMSVDYSVQLQENGLSKIAGKTSVIVKTQDYIEEREGSTND